MSLLKGGWRHPCLRAIKPIGNPPFLVMLTWGSWDIHRKTLPGCSCFRLSHLGWAERATGSCSYRCHGSWTQKNWDPLVGQNTCLSTTPQKMVGLYGRSFSVQVIRWMLFPLPYGFRFLKPRGFWFQTFQTPCLPQEPVDKVVSNIFQHHSTMFSNINYWHMLCIYMKPEENLFDTLTVQSKPQPWHVGKMKPPWPAVFVVVEMLFLLFPY